MSAKEYKFLSTVKVASDVAAKYPNYKINGLTPKTLAKRLISGNSEKGNFLDFISLFCTSALIIGSSFQ